MAIRTDSLESTAVTLNLISEIDEFKGSWAAIGRISPDRLTAPGQARAAVAARELHPLIAIAIFLVVFLEIHPFKDGNGRLSRILTTLLLLRAGYAYVPYSSLESIIEQNKEGYYRA